MAEIGKAALDCPSLGASGYILLLHSLVPKPLPSVLLHSLVSKALPSVLLHSLVSKALPSVLFKTAREIGLVTGIVQKVTSRLHHYTLVPPLCVTLVHRYTLVPTLPRPIRHRPQSWSCAGFRSSSNNMDLVPTLCSIMKHAPRLSTRLDSCATRL